MKKILIIGGAGFLGYNLTEKLIDKGLDVTVVTKNKDKMIKRFSGVEYIEWDINNDVPVFGSFRNFDICYYLASFKKNFKYHIENPANVFIQNLSTNIGFLKTIYTSDIKKIIIISSSTVYAPSNSPVDEHCALKNFDEDAYAMSKVVLEAGARFLAKEKKGFKIYVARCDNFFGEFDNFNNESQVIPSLIKKVINDEIIHVWGSGNQKRTFIYVKDVVNALIFLLDLNSDFDIFNISGQRVTSIKEIIDIIQKTVGVNKKIQFDLSKPEGVSIRNITSEKLQKITGWKQEFSLEIGIKKTIDYYLTAIKK